MASAIAIESGILQQRRFAVPGQTTLACCLQPGFGLLQRIAPIWKRRNLRLQRCFDGRQMLEIKRSQMLADARKTAAAQSCGKAGQPEPARAQTLQKCMIPRQQALLFLPARHVGVHETAQRGEVVTGIGCRGR